MSASEREEEHASSNLDFLERPNSEEAPAPKQVKLPSALKQLKESLVNKRCEINASSIAELSSEERQRAFSCLSNFFRDGRDDAKHEYREMARTPEDRYRYMAEFIVTECIPGKKNHSHSVKGCESMVGAWKTLAQLKGPLCFNNNDHAELYAAHAEWKFHDDPHLAAANVKVFRYIESSVSRGIKSETKKESNLTQTLSSSSGNFFKMGFR